MSTKRRMPTLLGLILPVAAALALAVPAHAQTDAAGATGSSAAKQHHHSSAHKAKSSHPHHKKAAPSGTSS